MKRLLAIAAAFAAFICPQRLDATKLMGIKTIDKDYIMVHFRDGEVRYRDDATGPSAYLGHSFAEGDDTLFVFGSRLDPEAAGIPAGWGLGRNPSNTVEMTGLGERHIIDCYTTGRNDGVPGSHPGQTPFNGTETWSPGHNGGDARVILTRCYPDWYTGGWPHQESFFNIRYMWVNGEFTPRETMRGKMALLAYLYGIRK